MLRRPAAVVLLALVALGTAGCTGDDDAARPTGTAATGTATAPAPAPTESLLPSPTSTGSAVGDLAAGFPSDLVSPPEGSEILVSSADTDAATGLTTISLNLRSPLATDQLVQAVRDQLVAAGFAETVVDPGSTGLAATSTFVRGDGAAELLTLGVLDRDGVRTLTLGGTVRL
ncbi:MULTISPECIES: hypothetical protein [unclassified Cellulomonas]|uniref:hypothetical protein n=1 Tax=unclassified Cellulomonas TaxID=2620175 RepID=UPI001C4F6E00|nr:hypothetical protein [Cellulomonas sp. PS-H5]MBW0254126.1 hypothetical protein [Cellulomonas sp. PS-H5]